MGISLNGSCNNLQYDVCVDGAYSNLIGLLGCGRVILDQAGSIVEAFTCGIKAGNSFEGEMWGCIYGLWRVWNLDFRNYRLWTDSLDIIELENVNDLDLHGTVELIREFKSLLAKDWTIEVVWRSPDENVHADYFANSLKFETWAPPFHA